MATSGDYQIINALHAHDGPVRCAMVRNDGEIITGCQSDAPNFRRWLQSTDSIEELGTSVPHDHWVTALTCLSPDISRDTLPEVTPSPKDYFYNLPLRFLFTFTGLYNLWLSRF